MASADSIEEAQEAQSKGYRTFRVALPQESLGRVKGEALCPASEEAGKKLQCHECLACGGNVKGMKGNIMINIHGNSAHLSNAKKIKLELVS